MGHGEVAGTDASNLRRRAADAGSAERSGRGHPLGRPHLRPRQRAPAGVGGEVLQRLEGLAARRDRAGRRMRHRARDRAARRPRPAWARAGRGRLPEMVELARRRLGGRARGLLPGRARPAAGRGGGRDRVHRHAALGARPRPAVADAGAGPAGRRAARGPVRRRGQHRARARDDRRGRARARPGALGFSPWHFAGAGETEQRLRRAGFEQVRCWLEPRPTEPEDPPAFIRTSILAAHLERLAPERREPFAAAVAAEGAPAARLRAPEHLRQACDPWLMASTFPEIDERLAGWIASQSMYFVASAPLGERRTRQRLSQGPDRDPAGARSPHRRLPGHGRQRRRDDRPHPRERAHRDHAVRLRGPAADPAPARRGRGDRRRARSASRS